MDFAHSCRMNIALCVCMYLVSSPAISSSATTSQVFDVVDRLSSLEITSHFVLDNSIPCYLFNLTIGF